MKLVIVESPTKAKTITKFLNKDYVIESSFGHVRDLPKSKIGVNIKQNFTPDYVIPQKAETQVRILRKLAKKADEIYLATDEDREGEAIAWHLYEILDVKNKAVKRIVFHEITKEAIVHALENPRDIDQNSVNAQQARRIVDRLVGYELSPFLWKKVQYGLSAGRVQSVAVRMIVERERERDAFKKEEYWTIETDFEKNKIKFPGKLNAIDDRILKKLDIKNEPTAQKIVNDLKNADFSVAKTEKKEIVKKAPAPLTTSTLQIEANNQLGFSAKQTMVLAQKLYETGKITYMRTDSLNLAQTFLANTQKFLQKSFGPQYATGSRVYKTKSKGAQEAHEAIRPTDVNVTPQTFKSRDNGQKRLYDLIWRRTVATQMPNAILERTTVDLKAKNYTFRANGSNVLFDGFMKVYHSAQDKILPALAEGDAVAHQEIIPAKHFTEPTARYSDATLVKALEEYGIGRPSTYAPTISTVISRGYVERDQNKKLYPLAIAYIVNDLLFEHFERIVDFEFTAKMEKDLDGVESGQQNWTKLVENFYTPFHENLTNKDSLLNKGDIMKERVVGKDLESGKNIIVKNGRFGPFVQLGEWSAEDKKAKLPKPKSASLFKGQSIETITLEEAKHLLILPRKVGKRENGDEILADDGRFGPYLRAGNVTASLKNQDPRTISLSEAKTLLTESEEKKKKLATPLAELGEDPNSKQKILIKNGRFGPYITDGVTNVSINKKLGIAPEKITTTMAVELLAKKRKQKKRFYAKT